MIFAKNVDPERRAAPRVTLDTPVVVRGKQWVMLGTGLNLSESGMALSVNREALITLDNRVLVTFILPSSPGWINILSAAVRQAYHEGKLLLGIHFHRLIPRSQQMVEAFVSHSLWTNSGIASSPKKT